MVRLGGMYEHKRSKLLLKRKEFQDGEFPVLEVLPQATATGLDRSRRPSLQLPDGRSFGAGLRGPPTR